MRKGFVLTLLILITFAFLSVNLVNNPFQESEPDVSPIGELLKVRGETLSKTQNQDFFHKASSGQKLFPTQKLMTSFDSQALIDLGTKFWLMSNSYIRLDKDKNNFNVHVLSGKVKIKGEASNNVHFFVEGKEQKGEVIQKGAIAQMTHLPLDGIQMEHPGQAQTTTTSIDEKQIHQTFKLHQRFVEKCFIKHYSRSNGQTRSGKVWIRFMVGKSGRLRQSQVKRSDYKDGAFHNCLLEVVSRVRLKNYSGPQVQVEFPIDIQLPQ